MEISDIRKDYIKFGLLEIDLLVSPINQFKKWFDEALQSKALEPNAMVLSTVSLENRPSSRVVLLKGIDEKGFSFFTNYNSKKGNEISENPFGCLTFFWPELERQIRIEGEIEKLSFEVSTSYFQSRPKGSQIGAWASPQSNTIKGRDILEEREKEFFDKFQNGNIPKPLNWGGYQLLPDYFEFWQGRSSRLHDRLIYTKTTKNEWKISRLAP